MEMAKRLSAGIIALLLISTHAKAMTANEYLSFDEVARQMWVIGALDGLLTANFFESDPQPHRLAKCIEGKTPSQIKAALEKSLEKTPETWHFPVSYELMMVLRRFCSPSHNQ